MSYDAGLLDWIEESLAPIGEITSRSMMGGKVLYCDGTVFAILTQDELWFKSDVESDAAWDDAGCERFTYTFRDGHTGTMNYRRAPSDVHDDPDEMRRWAALALEAGRRAPVKKPRKSRKKG